MTPEQKAQISAAARAGIEELFAATPTIPPFYKIRDYIYGSTLFKSNEETETAMTQALKLFGQLSTKRREQEKALKEKLMSGIWD